MATLAGLVDECPPATQKFDSELLAEKSAPTPVRVGAELLATATPAITAGPVVGASVRVCEAPWPDALPTSEGAEPVNA